jgi:hypothetical protein
MWVPEAVALVRFCRSGDLSAMSRGPLGSAAGRKHCVCVTRSPHVRRRIDRRLAVLRQKFDGEAGPNARPRITPPSAESDCIVCVSGHGDECMLNSSWVWAPWGDPQETVFDSIWLSAFLLPDRQAFYPASRYYYTLSVIKFSRINLGSLPLSYT